MKSITKYDVNDVVWCCEYNDMDGYYHVIRRTIDYIKICLENVYYGFVYGIEVPEEMCYEDKHSADIMCAINNRHVDEWRVCM